MTFSKLLISALFLAVFLGLYFSNSLATAQTKACEVSSNTLEQLIQTLGYSEVSINSVNSNVIEFDLNLKSEGFPLDQHLYLLQGAKENAQEASDTLQEIRRSLEAQLINCSPYKN